jgi:hypothetical protein
LWTPLSNAIIAKIIISARIYASTASPLGLRAILSKFITYKIGIAK